ncbi:MAG: YHYH protein [Myxococcales bacterium]|nr:YHYH protein [Myxococcales bacterium]
MKTAYPSALSPTALLFALSAAAVSVPVAACGDSAETKAATGAGGAAESGGTTSTTAAGGNTTTAGGADGCPDENFLDVSTFDGAGASYPKPTLAVTCENGEVLVTGNGIPHYAFMPVTPNDLSAQANAFHFPQVPKAAAATSEVPLLGTAGVAVNGAVFYGPNEAAKPDPYGDPVYNGIMDDCLGHTSGIGQYHYHALLVACLTKTEVPGAASPIIAYAWDGFPVYGPNECADADCKSVIEMKSSWVKTGDPSTYAWDNNACTAATCDAPAGEYLDRCNGHTGPDGDYHYHATLAKNEPTYTGFPYIIGCFHGTPTQNGMGGGMTGGGMTGGGGMLPPCPMGQMQMCCGDGKCMGPETAANCPADCP